MPPSQSPPRPSSKPAPKVTCGFAPVSHCWRCLVSVLFQAAPCIGTCCRVECGRNCSATRTSKLEGKTPGEGLTLQICKRLAGLVNLPHGQALPFWLLKRFASETRMICTRSGFVFVAYETVVTMLLLRSVESRNKIFWQFANTHASILIAIHL